MAPPFDKAIFGYLDADGEWRPYSKAELDIAEAGAAPTVHATYGASHTPRHQLTAADAPVIDDDVTRGYGVGSWFFDILHDKVYTCLDATEGAAVWVEAGGGVGVHDLGGAAHNADTLAHLNDKVSDATLDDSGASRPPTAHAASHVNGDAIQNATNAQKGLATAAQITMLETHAGRHENGGADEISVAGLSGELADAQPPKAHDLGGAAHNADTLAHLNDKVSDATLDDSGDSRPPTAHDLAGALHNADTLAHLNDKVSDATLADKVTILDGPLSPQLLLNGVISDGTNAGTIAVSGVMSALFRTGVGAADPLEYVTLVAQDNLALAAADTVYHVVFTRAGPAISIQVANANGTTEIGIGTCTKDAANNVHWANAGMRLQNGVAKLHTRAASLRGTELCCGCAIGDLTNQRFSIEAGEVYHGITGMQPFLAGAYSSLTDKFVSVYGDTANGFTFSAIPAAETDLDNTQYYDGAGALATAGNNNYIVHWVYLHPDDEHVYVMYGEINGKLAEAEQAQPPADRPLVLSSFAVLLGKIIIKESETTITLVQMVTDQIFTGAAVADHGSLTGLTDDDHTQYYNEARGDARYPQLVHAARHENGGGDEISVAGLSGELADNQNPTAHAASHVDGTDDIRDATNALKGLATAAQITALEAAVTAGANLTDDFIVRGDGGAKGVQTSLVKITDAGMIQVPDNQGISSDTADASDNKAIALAGGGAADITRGGMISLHGNEDAGTGRVILRAGNVVGGTIDFFTDNGQLRMGIAKDGTIVLYGVTTLADGSTLATSAAPLADAQIANKKYVDDNAGAVPFGAWTNLDSDSDALVKDAVYQVTSDGFVVAYSEVMDWADRMQIYSDGSSPPTTLRQRQRGEDQLDRTELSFTIPVKNGDYWKLECTETATIFWIPIGSGECEIQP